MVSQSILIKLWLLTNKNTEEFNVFVMWLQQVDKVTTNLVEKKLMTWYIYTLISTICCSMFP